MGKHDDAIKDIHCPQDSPIIISVSYDKTREYPQSDFEQFWVRIYFRTGSKFFDLDRKLFDLLEIFRTSFRAVRILFRIFLSFRTKIRTC